MEEKENSMMNIHVHTFADLVQKTAKYEDFRKKRNLATQNCRARKKMAEAAAKNARILRAVPRQIHQDILVSHILEEISKLSIDERKSAVQSKFRTMTMYNINKCDTSYIIQMEHNGTYID